MPLIFQNADPTFQMGVWLIEESEDYFLKTFAYAQDELAEIGRRNIQHRLQLLASRAVLQGLRISDSGYKFLKDHHGKPHIINVQGDISFTHSHDRAAAIYSKNLLVGIDIQLATDKISKIASKFISEEEMEYVQGKQNEPDYQHILWGAKESLYKAYGRRKVDFKCNLKISPFVYKKEGSIISGWVDMPDYQGEFDIYYQKISEYYLVYCIEKHEE